MSLTKKTIVINSRICGGCGDCVAVCRSKSLVMHDGKATFRKTSCNFCGKCIDACEVEAITYSESGFGAVGSFETTARKRIREIIIEQLGVNEIQVTWSANLIDDLGADSLDCVELVMAFEEEFGVAIPEEDTLQLKTVGDIIRYFEVRGYCV